MNDNVKILRLQGGEDIIAQYLEEDDIALLYNPMQMLVKRTRKGSAMFLLPWLPVELISDNMATIYLSDILTTMEPKKDMIEYYGNAIAKMFVKQAIEMEMQEEVISESEDTEEYYTEVLKSVKIGTVH